MDLDEFTDQLANGDSNDHEIDCLKTALEEAFYLLDGDSQQVLEARLPSILAGM